MAVMSYEASAASRAAIRLRLEDCVGLSGCTAGAEQSHGMQHMPRHPFVGLERAALVPTNFKVVAWSLDKKL